MNASQLRKRLEQLEDEARQLREKVAATLPRSVKVGPSTLIARPHAVDVDCDGWALQWTNDHAQAVRDFLLAAYPLDTAPDAGWVSVEERLPPNESIVQVFTDGEFQHTARRQRDGRWTECNIGRQIVAKVTHWRELPAPPAAKGGSSE